MLASALLVFAALGLAAPLPSPLGEPTSPTSPAPEGSRSPTYESRSIEGVPFRVGTTPHHEAWIAVRPGSGIDFRGGVEPCLVLIVVNSDLEPVAFDPASLRVWSLSDRGEKALKTLSAEEVERRLRSRNAMIGSLRGRSLNKDPQRPPSPVLGASGSEAPNVGVAPLETQLSGGSSGRFSETGRTLGDEVARMDEGLRSTLHQIASKVMRPRTLEPRSYYGGLVYLDKVKARAIRVEMKVGEEEFRFELSAAQP